MKNIAFKRAKSVEIVKDSLHPDFIVEYADTSLFEEGFHRIEDGYEILSEDMFEIELSKNDELHDLFIEKKNQLEQEKNRIQAMLDNQELTQERKDKREYEEFLKWKKMKGKR